MELTDGTILEVLVKPSEIDPYKVAHHSAYLCWYEQGIVEFLKSYIEDEDKRNRLLETYFIQKVESKYVAAAKVSDSLSVTTCLKKQDGDDRILVFQQKIIEQSKNRIINKATLTVSY